jgi:hypothetical protein
MPNCDWGRPCDCNECCGDRADSVRDQLGKPCGYCRKNPATGVHHNFTVDRKGMGGYDAVPCCGECSGGRRQAIPLPPPPPSPRSIPMAYPCDLCREFATKLTCVNLATTERFACHDCVMAGYGRPLVDPDLFWRAQRRRRR